VKVRPVYVVSIWIPDTIPSLYQTQSAMGSSVNIRDSGRPTRKGEVEALVNVNIQGPEPRLSSTFPPRSTPE
jgi:hypothetical protein